MVAKTKLEALREAESERDSALKEAAALRRENDILRKMLLGAGLDKVFIDRCMKEVRGK
jgi:hypothetical protein